MTIKSKDVIHSNELRNSHCWKKTGPAFVMPTDR